MVGIYVGATSGYSGKNLIAMGLGLKFQKDGLNVGYIKPVGAMPVEKNGKMGDEDAFFVQEVLGLNEDPNLVTPVLVTPDFKARAFAGLTSDLMGDIKRSFETVSKSKDVTIVAGSGSMYSGKYCNVDAVEVVRTLGIHALVIDRFTKELNYDYLIVLKDALGDQFIGTVLNDIPLDYMQELKNQIVPLLERSGVKVLGVIPRDPLLGAIQVAELAKRLGGRIVTAQHKTDRVVENFLIGSMQVENFMIHFRKNKNTAIIMGGDRSDVQLVALEGECPCLVLTGNIYPNDIILTRAEVKEIPIIVVRDDTFSISKKMNFILSHLKLRDMVKIQQGAQVVANNVDIAYIKEKIGLR
jgi:BioD-like phosphotransacetylase family protein